MPETSKSVAARTDTSESAPQETAPPAARQPVAAASPDTAQVRQIAISTEKYRAVVSSRGALLQECELKDYVTSDGDPVRLLPNGGEGMGLLVGPGGKEIDLRQRVFSVSAPDDRYTLTGKDSVALAFTYVLPTGKQLYKRYTFYGNTYTVRFSSGFADSLYSERVVLLWEGEVPHAEGDFQRSVGHMRAEAYVGGSLEKFQVKDKPDSSAVTGQTDWVGVRNKYFLTAFAPSGIERWSVKLRGRGASSLFVNYGWRITPDDITQSHIEGTLYLGPIDVDILKSAGHNLDQAADMGWAIIRPISTLILWFFLAMYKLIPNYGWVIIIFSVVVKIVLHPLTKKSYESTSKMQKLKPLMDELRQKYKNDQQRLNQEMLKLYKEQGFNPLGGCLPMLLQMPIFFAIYAVIGNNIEFRQAGFIWWITDLSVPDVIYTLPFHLPIYGQHVTILPVLMAISMFIQQKLTLTDPKQKMLIYLMPFIMLFVFNNLSSGLVLYWFMFNILSSAHQYWLTQRQKAQTDAAEGKLAPAPVVVKNPTKRRKR